MRLRKYFALSLTLVLTWVTPVIAGPSKLISTGKLTADVANSILQHRESPAAAMSRLRQAISAIGLTAEPDADFAIAAMSVGHSLYGAGQSAAAQVFFQAAEQTLGACLRRPGLYLAAGERASYLKTLAHVRSEFLGKTLEAKADVDEAILLLPNDRGLQAAKARLAERSIAQSKGFDGKN